jgi:hypothetical protein
VKEHGCFGSTERSAGKQLECPALFRTDGTFSTRHRHLGNSTDEIRIELLRSEPPAQTWAPIEQLPMLLSCSGGVTLSACPPLQYPTSEVAGSLGGKAAVRC